MDNRKLLELAEESFDIYEHQFTEVQIKLMLIIAICHLTEALKKKDGHAD